MGVLDEKIGALSGAVDAVNITDNQTSVVRMSSIAGCVILKELGFDPILQMVVRDRNRISIQSDILGAAAIVGAVTIAPIVGATLTGSPTLASWRDVTSHVCGIM